MINKEEILKKLLKDLLEQRINRLEKRNIEQMKDIKLEKESYNKQGLLLKKLCSIKIEPKNNMKKNNTNRFSGRSRDKTPTNFRTKMKNSKNDNDNDKKMIRSKTPNIVMTRKNKESKKNEKKDNINKSKMSIKTIKNAKTSNNIKKISNMDRTKTNLNRNKKVIDNKNNIARKAKTPDIRQKNNSSRTKISTKSNNINNNKNKIKKEENNLKLIDIKVDDMKEFIETEEKKSKPEEVEKKEDITIEEKEEIKEKKEEKKICCFEPLMDNNKLINIISAFLDDSSQYNLFSCNKKLSKYLYEKLITNLELLKSNNNITSSSTIQDQINSLKLKYTNEVLNEEPPKFSLSKGTIKAIELLNEDNYNKIFNEKELNQPLNEILFVYRIFFQLLKVNNIYQIKDDKLFWMEASEYILKNNNGKTGEFFKDSINNFDFSIKNIYEVKKIVSGNEDKIKPTVFSKICSTTGLVIFLIKDSLEYIGVIHNIKKNIPFFSLKYLEFIGDLQNKIEKYKNYIKTINNNI